MAKQTIDRETRKAIMNARSMIEDVAKADGNEAETRRRVERIFGSLMGYDVLKHITREHAVHGVGDTEYCDFAIKLDNKESSIPIMLIELKRVNIDLTPKHLKQASSYAVNMGCEWVLLTNGKEWKLYHISFTQPPQIKMVESWDLINGEPATLAKKFALIGYKNIKKNGLAKLWEKRNVLTTRNVLKVILSEQSLNSIRREIKKITDVSVTPEEVVGSIRHMLNEASLGEMDKVRICLPEKRQKKPASRKKPEAQGDKPKSESAEMTKEGT